MTNPSPSLLPYCQVRGNKLVSVPDEITGLCQLQELDLSCNQLDRLPAGIFGLVNLRRLNVRRNNLIELPEVPTTTMSTPGYGAGGGSPSAAAISSSSSHRINADLSSSSSRLVSLDVSSNRVQRLPLSLRHLKETLQTLVLDHNPLDLPPAHVCKRGRLHVFKALEKEFLKEKCKGEVINSFYHQQSRAQGYFFDNF